MSVTEILLITINALIVIGVAYVFVKGAPEDMENSAPGQEGEALQQMQ